LTRHVDSRAAKNAEHALAFLRKNELQDFAGLMEFCKDLYRELGGIQEELKHFNHREKTLKEHVRQAEYLKEFQPFYKAHQSLKLRKQPQFYEAHRREIMLYESAKRYFKEHRIEPTSKQCREELNRLPERRQPFYQKYHAIKEQSQQADKVRYGVENVLRREKARTRPQHRNRTRSWDMER